MSLMKYTGKVKQVFSKKMDTPDNYGNEYRYSIKMEDDKWYSVGSGKYEAFALADDDGTYKPVGVGTELLLKYEQNGDFRNVKKSNITVLDFVVAEKKATQGANARAGIAAAARSGRDNSGIETGHALNGAAIWLDLSKANAVELRKTAEDIHILTTQMKAYYAETFPKASEYDAGASSGNAILNALRIAKAKGKGLDAVLTIAKQIIGVAQALQSDIQRGSVKGSGVVQGSAVEQQEEAPEPAPEVVETPVEAPKPTPVPATRGRGRPKAAPAPVEQPPAEDFDDDIPF